MERELFNCHYLCKFEVHFFFLIIVSRKRSLDLKTMLREWRTEMDLAVASELWSRRSCPIAIGFWLGRTCPGLKPWCVSVVCSVMSDSVRWDLLSMEFSTQEYWSGLPFLTPGDLPNPGIEPTSPALQADSLPLSYLGSPYRMVDFGKSCNLSTHQLSHQ